MNQTNRDAKILIVDDNEDNVAVAEQMLRKASYSSIQTTTDSRQTLSMVADITPDLLILDLLMPPPDGFAILDELRICPTRDKLMPILVLTGDVVPATKVKALAMGAKDFLTKPVDRVDLLLRVRNLIDWRFAEQELRTEKTRRMALEQCERLAEVDDDILRSLARVFACMDPERADSGERVATLAIQTGAELLLEEKTLARLRSAAQLFDLGMLALPESIRQSRKTLTAEERREMKRHTLIAKQLFINAHYPALEMAREIALAHHERWDGAGYPLGLKGADIPLVARIVAVAQVYDALVTDKPYRSAMAPEEAMEEVQRQSGFAFDPDVVRAFQQAIEKACEASDEPVVV